MAIIRALKGFRYNQNKISNISDVIAPPYDVINSDQQKKLLNSSEHNVVHIDFNDGIDDEKYNLSKNKLNQWFESEILIQENKHAIYPYLQKFEFMNETYQRFGIMCLVKLEEFNKRVILPHEQTFSGPKEDRLKLIRACRTNLSPIFGVFDDSDNKFNKITYDKINNLKPIIDKYVTKVFATECPLYSDHLKLAGTCDCIAEWHGVPTVIDFKTSRRPKKKVDIPAYFCQLAAYAVMWEERSGMAITNLVVIMDVDDF